MVSDSTARMDFDVEYSELLRGVSLALPHRRTVGRVYLLLVHSWLDGSVPAETDGLSSVNMVFLCV
jgi:squalene cyclase